MNRHEDYEVSTGNVFRDLGLEDSEELIARAQLMHELGILIKASPLSHKQIADKLGISSSRVMMLISGKFNDFTVENLMHYLSLIGCYVEISIRKPRTKGLFFRKGYIAVSA